MQWLLMVVFAAHLLCVNVAAAGPLVAAGLDWLEGRGNRLAGKAGRYLAWWAAALLVPGGLLGVVIGLLVWDGEYRQILGRLSSKIHFGAWELLFSQVLMLAYAWWWQARPAATGWQRRLRIFVALLASTNLLYHFPTLFAVIEHSVSSGEVSGEPISAAGFRSIVAQSALLSRVTHFILAAIATCGIVLLGYALRMMRRKADPADVQRVAAWGGQIALLPTLAQLPVGLWLTASLSRPLQSAVTGSDMPATLLLGASVMLAIWLMHLLAVISIGDSQRSTLIKAMLALVVIVTLMSGVLQRLRAIGAERAAAVAPST